MAKVLFGSILVMLLANVAAAQEARLALVIGNGRYAENPLQNPTNDARDMADVLQDLGFTVIQRENADFRAMKEATRDFGLRLQRQQGVGLFFYSGHGLEYQGRNYLVPIDASIRREAEIEFDLFAVDRILAEMEHANNGVNIVVLDACRSNPLGRSFNRRVPGGLATVEGPRGSLIAFATSPNKTASDGTERNGTYTEHLLDALRTHANESALDLFTRVHGNVRRETAEEQSPWITSSLDQTFCFGPCATVSAGTGSSVQDDNLRKLKERLDELERAQKEQQKPQPEPQRPQQVQQHTQVDPHETKWPDIGLSGSEERGPKRWSFHLGGGYAKSANEGAPDGSFGVTGGVVHWIRSSVAIGGEAGYLEIENDEIDLGFGEKIKGKIYTIPITFQGLFFIPADGPIVPGIATGAGIYSTSVGFDDGYRDETSSSNDFGINVGGVLRFGNRQSRWNAGLDARYHVVFGDGGSLKIMTLMWRVLIS